MMFSLNSQAFDIIWLRVQQNPDENAILDDNACPLDAALLGFRVSENLRCSLKLFTAAGVILNCCIGSRYSLLR